MPHRRNVMVAVSTAEAEAYCELIPDFRDHLVLTPDRTIRGFLVDTYVWTPEAAKLPARVRMRLRGELAPMIDGRSVEEEFPLTLLSW